MGLSLMDVLLEKTIFNDILVNLFGKGNLSDGYFIRNLKRACSFGYLLDR